MKKENQKIAMLVLSIAILAFMAGPALADGTKSGFFRFITDVTVFRLNDRVEIEQLLKDYAWGVDHKDTELWMNIWSENAVYDLSDLGFGTVEGLQALQGFMNCVVFPGEPMCFSLISNIDIKFTGIDTAEGTDYFIHEGYVPVDKTTNPTTKFNQFNPASWYLLDDLLDALDPSKDNQCLDPAEFTFVRDHKEGQHIYEFVRENGKWKISYLKGAPLFSASEDVTPANSMACGGVVIPIEQSPNIDFFTNWKQYRMDCLQQ